jgi:hypothetical protein
MNVFEETAAFVVKVEEYAKRSAAKNVCLLLAWLHFNTDDGGNEFLRNVCEFLPNYKASHLRSGNIVHGEACENLKSNQQRSPSCTLSRFCLSDLSTTCGLAIATVQFSMVGDLKLDDVLGKSGRGFVRRTQASIEFEFHPRRVFIMKPSLLWVAVCNIPLRMWFLR